MKERANERLDNSIHSAADSVDWRLYGFPRRRRTNSLIARIRRDLVDLAFRNGCAGDLRF